MAPERIISVSKKVKKTVSGAGIMYNKITGWCCAGVLRVAVFF
jgi:hypothetical protein